MVVSVKKHKCLRMTCVCAVCAHVCLSAGESTHCQRQDSFSKELGCQPCLSWAFSPIQGQRKRERKTPAARSFSTITYKSTLQTNVNLMQVLSERNVYCSRRFTGTWNTWWNPHNQCVWPLTSSITQRKQKTWKWPMCCCEHGWLGREKEINVEGTGFIGIYFVRLWTDSL